MRLLGVISAKELPSEEDLAVAVNVILYELIFENALQALEKHYGGAAESSPCESGVARKAAGRKLRVVACKNRGRRSWPDPASGTNNGATTGDRRCADRAKPSPSSCELQSSSRLWFSGSKGAIITNKKGVAVVATPFWFYTANFAITSGGGVDSPTDDRHER
jgi:hypothetical protein